MKTPATPFDESPRGRGSDKLKGRTALITGGNSGIGRATALLFAREGAKVAITYFSGPDDAEETLARIKDQGGEEGVAVHMDAKSNPSVRAAVDKALGALGGRLDVLVCNASMQVAEDDILKVEPEQAREILTTNVLGYLWGVQAALPHMREGGAIVFTTSVVAYKGNEMLVDYATSKGGELSLMRSLAAQLVKKGIRVNGVAPGPIWTPFITESMPAAKLPSFGTDVPMGRPGEAWELAPAYLYLASDDSTYVTGQVIHVNGGMPVAS